MPREVPADAQSLRFASVPVRVSSVADAASCLVGGPTRFSPPLSAMRRALVRVRLLVSRTTRAARPKKSPTSLVGRQLAVLRPARLVRPKPRSCCVNPCSRMLVSGLAATTVRLSPPRSPRRTRRDLDHGNDFGMSSGRTAYPIHRARLRHPMCGICSHRAAIVKCCVSGFCWSHGA